MADGQGSAHGALTGRGHDTLTRQIEQARDDLARTVDAIADRVSPANNARRLADRAKHQAADVQRRLAGLDPRLVAVGAAVGIGIVVLVVRRRRHR